MRDTSLRKVLVVAYHFHPDLEVGAVRSVKFAKYLPEFGWKVHVVSVASEYYERTDSAPLPFECAVHQARMWPTILTAGLCLQDALFRLSSRLRRRADEHRLSEQACTSEAPRPKVFWRRLVLKFGATPDASVGWLLPATWLAIRVVRRERIDVLYSSGPPHTAHLVGLLTCWVTGRPLISDFRDPWTTRPASADLLDRAFFRLERMLELLVVRRSALVIGSTQAICDRLVAAHHPGIAEKCVALLNGFDAEDFPDVSEHRDSDADRPISFVYAGTLYAGRDPRVFLRVLGEMIREQALSARAVAVDFYGPVEIEASPLQAIVDEFALRDVVSFRNTVGRKEYLRLLWEADVLILIQGDQTPWAIPAKTFEYLATGNEILLLAGAHAVAELLEGHDNVHRSPIDDPVSIRGCIRSIVGRIRSGESRRYAHRQSLVRLHKRELTREFARLLDTVVSPE